MLDIWFWQTIVTPHMMGLSVAMVDLGVKVIYVAEDHMTIDRQQQGWLEPVASGVHVEIAENEGAVRQIVARAPEESIHICQGIRANGLVGVAQKHLASRGITQWVVMETVRNVGWRGIIKRFEYARLFRKNRSSMSGVLAIGYRAPQWVTQRGVDEEKVFPFAYFLEKGDPLEVTVKTDTHFKFIFVGQFIPLKRLDWLINALGGLTDQKFELVVIGTGPLEDALRTKAESVLGDKVKWIGKLPSNEVRAYMADSDCLVLPSLYDGWGAVASEALMCGTPVICSDTCGSAGVVESSGVGGVFEANSFAGLQALLQEAVNVWRLPLERRRQLIRWSETISSQAGASYLLDILASYQRQTGKPPPPWVETPMVAPIVTRG